MRDTMLDERTKKVLYAVVESYIEKPEPVGSRYIMKKYGFDVCSATIRNIMSDLEDAGFLSQPHTSAGRVPTDKAYRFYVDYIFQSELFSQSLEIKRVIENLTKKLRKLRNNMNSLFLETTQSLSQATRYLGLALLPATEKTALHRVDFIKFKDDLVIAVVVNDKGIVKNKIIKVYPEITQKELNSLADFVNRNYHGKTIDEIRDDLIVRIKKEKIFWDRLISKILKMCQEALYFSREDVYVSGFYHIMHLPDFSDIEKLREVAKTIQDRHLLLKLFENISEDDEVKVIIGQENPVEEFRSFSIIASPYKEKDKSLGVIALVGPKRMNYQRAIMLVNAFARSLTRTLSD
ncbi:MULTISPECIES: heat-inducible transcriptional repressor HrcA [Thermodesulfovibrio]|uniref:Heat-inducible transcription repressor HrcA n=2 Tax=Thermodesulfovibrio yellowstonii TaxID=28262 RepID=HRCA_THEYD|nr:MULTISPECIES: heat-inducible transcriptional repressor HrcA [Thermodesulfovibrio]B5YH61.1 RecName: Full=Heat-inducible transcription repressor HrcA [Thermodesulfovibrio yellowstonii DSM 11347]ACI21027.1 heat-inducible transcription repressor HrcA [Thermodesulfovibrio yellowstonii DSM 11347]MDI6865568.1 heat-inducible transcriptional repressor HrcA [Thermodesulfovibrio yellowstonii]GLI52869.1 heat-inducible transcription repressor HrcA [Thermodesulfovibrio islandicus]